MRTVTPIMPIKRASKRPNVAAYARVSSGKDAMSHSLSAQISYCSDLIKAHPDWDFVRVYADPICQKKI